MTESHDKTRYSTAYVVELGRIAWSLAQRARQGEPVEDLVRDARLLYAGAWHDEVRRARHG
jgi:hypothetical protein